MKTQKRKSIGKPPDDNNAKNVETSKPLTYLVILGELW